MNRKRLSTGVRGVTLTELLVVLAIISLLATIIVPVTINKMEEARISTARTEVREIANAEDTCGAIHGFYVPFHILNDLNPNIDQTVQNSSVVHPDTLTNSFQSANVFLTDPLRRLTLQLNNQPDFASFTVRQAIPRVETMYEFWAGPFITYKRVYKLSGQTASLSDVDVQDDFPLDPWGQPYRFYSPLGIIGSGAEATSGWTANSFDGLLTQQIPEDFDRFAVVSWGPNGAPNSFFGTQVGIFGTDRDDIVYEFGGLFTESSFQAF